MVSILISTRLKTTILDSTCTASRFRRLFCSGCCYMGPTTPQFAMNTCPVPTPARQCRFWSGR